MLPSMHIGLCSSTADLPRAALRGERAAWRAGADVRLRWPAQTVWPCVARCTGGALRAARSVCSKASGSHPAPVRAAGTPGGGVIDRPTTTPDITRKKETLKQRPRFYRVMLHNDNYNRREYVVQVLLKVIPGMTVDDAVNVMQEAHVNGLACVIACAQQEAEEYCERLRLNGLMVTLEPSGNEGSGSPDAC